MTIRLLTISVAAALLVGCPKVERKNNKAKSDRPDPIPTKDQSSDVTFQAFVGRLRTAVMRRDRDVLASMMAPDFGYRWDAGPQGEDVFAYWDKNNLWPELSSLMNEHWVPYDGFMVVPPQLAQDSEYRGFRAGVQRKGRQLAVRLLCPGAAVSESDPIALGLPHREPFLFVDRVLAYVPGESAECAKSFPPETPFFAGHFPGEPIVPGVILAEALAQTAGLAAGQPGKGFRLTALRTMKFPSAARPGEAIRLHARKAGVVGGLWQFDCRAVVEERVVAEGVVVLSEVG